MNQTTQASKIIASVIAEPINNMLSRIVAIESLAKPVEIARIQFATGQDTFIFRDGSGIAVKRYPLADYAVIAAPLRGNTVAIDIAAACVIGLAVAMTAVNYGEGGKAVSAEADSAAICYGVEGWAVARGERSTAYAFGDNSKAECYGRDSQAIVGDIGRAVAHRPCGQLMGGAGAELRWVMPDSPSGDIVHVVGSGGIAPDVMYHLLDGCPRAVTASS